MTVGRKPNPSYIVDQDIKVIFCPVPEPSVAFRKRKDEVQELILKMILLGRKKGRPSKKEEAYEEVA